MKYDKFINNTDFIFSHVIETQKRKSYKMESHYHNLYEIYLIESGTCNYFIDNKSYQLEDGDIVLIPEGTIHNTEYINTVHSRMLINCSRKYIPSAIKEYLPKSQYLYRNPKIKDEVIELFKKIKHEYNNGDGLSEEILKCYTHAFFYLLIRNIETQTKVNSKNKYIETAITYIKENLKNDITLTQIAKECSLSPEHLSRMFKKETGFGFCEYLNLLRLQKAEALLKQSDNLSISQIACECGFNDSNYFSVKFKKMYGISPKKLQKNN
jgi:AraC-like DNA-binding protein